MPHSRFQLDSLLAQAGWYVLAGGVRSHALELPKEACVKIRTLAVEVHTEGATFQAWSDVQPGACDP
jgi:hypothetical protein